jgi:hypothetical protein
MESQGICVVRESQGISLRVRENFVVVYILSYFVCNNMPLIYSDTLFQLQKVVNYTTVTGKQFVILLLSFSVKLLDPCRFGV